MAHSAQKKQAAGVRLKAQGKRTDDGKPYFAFQASQSKQMAK
jgi:hypothetical protein